MDWIVSGKAPAFQRSYSSAATLPIARTGVRPRSRSAGATV